MGEYEDIKESNCPNSEYNRLFLQNKIKSAERKNKALIEALQRIADTYDNVEDLAGVIARTALNENK